VPDFSPKEVVSPCNPVGIVFWRLDDSRDLLTNLRARALVCIDNQDPWAFSARNRCVSLATDGREWIVDYDGTGAFGNRRSVVSRSVLDDENFSRPSYALDAFADVVRFIARGNDRSDFDTLRLGVSNPPRICNSAYLCASRRRSAASKPSIIAVSGN
jgi:hypothetical protein